MNMSVHDYISQQVYESDDGVILVSTVAYNC